MGADAAQDDIRVRPHEPARRRKERAEHPVSDLPLFAAGLQEIATEEMQPTSDDLEQVIQFPGLRL